MSEGPERLKLVAYENVATHGYCIALYGQQQGANTHYIARQATNEKHQSGIILDFQPIDAENVKLLPAELVSEFANDDPWPDVFLWNGTPYVGTADQLWEQLSPFRAAMEQTAPISLLDLALNTASPLSDEIARISLDYVKSRFGDAIAHSWRKSLLTSRIQMAAARNLFIGKAPEDLEIGLTDAGPGQFNIVVTEESEQSDEIFDALTKTIASLAGLARSLGVTIELRQDAAFAETIVNAGEALPTKAEVYPQRSFQDEVTIFSMGQRAKEIVRNIANPTANRTSASPGMHIIYGEKQAFQFTMEPWRNRLVFVVMDEADTLAPHIIVAMGQKIFEMSKEGATVIFVPALPENHPSRYLETISQPHGLLSGARAILDTSIARSPFWWGDPKRSLDRRIADIIGIAISASRDRLEPHLETNDNSKGLPVLALARPPVASKPVNIRQYFLSESFWKEHFPSLDGFEDGRSGRAYQEKGTTEFFETGIDPANFPRFAAEVVGGITSQFRDRAKRDLRLLENPKTNALRRQLKFKEHLCGFEAKRQEEGQYRILVTAEKPSLEAVQTADRERWDIVRYTDRATLTRLLQSPQRVKGSLPDEVDIGKYNTTPANRQLAARGIDQRDVIPIVYSEYHEWLDRVSPQDRPQVIESTRVVRSAKNPFSRLMDDHIVRRDILANVGSVVSVLQDILSRRGLSAKYRPLKRGSDLHRCWSPPIAGWKRFGIIDGILPVTVIDLQAGEAPMQDIFIVDGDEAVPVLFQSRPFALWAQATLPSASSWMARFSVTNTFGGFPIPEAFTVTRYENTISSLSFPEMPDRVKSLSDELAKHVARSIAAGSGESWKRTHRLALDLPAIEEINAFVLELYGLSSDATDIEIMIRLMEMNHKMSRLKL